MSRQWGGVHISFLFIKIINKTAYKQRDIILSFSKRRNPLFFYENGMQIYNTVKAELMKCNEVNDARVSHKDGKAIVNINVFEFGVDEIILAKRSSQISQGRKKWGDVIPPHFFIR